MIEAMEVVVGNNDSLGGDLAAAEEDNEVFISPLSCFSYFDMWTELIST